MRTILSPGAYCYFDSYQDAPRTQPEAIGGYLPLEKVYSYEPVTEAFPADKLDCVWGVQGNVWTEYIPTPEHAEYMIYPRLLALAEVAWTNPEQKDWKRFPCRGFTGSKGAELNGLPYFLTCKMR